MGKLRIKGETSGYVDLQAPNVAGDTTIQLDNIMEKSGDSMTGDLHIGTSHGVYTGTQDPSEIKLINFDETFWNGNAGDTRQAKISLYGLDSDDFYGIGISNGSLNLFAAGSMRLFTGDGNPKSERLKIDPNGNVTKPHQISFMVNGNQNDYASRVTVDGYTNVVPFNNVAEGNSNTTTGWDSTKHRFTAPVTGRYLVSLWTLRASATQQEVHIRRNGNEYVARFYESNNRRNGGTAIVNLSKNSWIHITADHDVYLHNNNPYSGLSIMLIG